MIFIELIFASHLLDIFNTMIFLEIIELKFCGFTRNLKRNIKDRVDLQVRKSLEDINKKNEDLFERNESFDTSFDNENEIKDE